jgi:hypothetical protein
MGLAPGRVSWFNRPMADKPTQGHRSKIVTGDVRLARDLILAQLLPLRESIVAHLDSGDREFVTLREKVERYIDYLTAADALGYTTSIEDRA